MTPQFTLEKFGYKFGQSGAHSARSMMLADLQTLFGVTDIEASQKQYETEICDHNVLEKPTTKSRNLTYRHLVDLFGMNTRLVMFKVFRQLWIVDANSQPVLCLQLALARDPLLRLSAPLIKGTQTGDPITRENVEELLKTPNPDRFSPASLRSFAQNINGSWTQAGFLKGKAHKQRAVPVVTPVNVAFALFQGYLEGASGERLLSSEHCKLFNLTDHQLNELAIAAGHRGIIDFKQSGGVTDIRFPGYLDTEQEAWLHE